MTVEPGYITTPASMLKNPWGYFTSRVSPLRFALIAGLPCRVHAATLKHMNSAVAHIAMMMVMEMPSPGHFAMPRFRRAHGETGRLR